MVDFILLRFKLHMTVVFESSSFSSAFTTLVLVVLVRTMSRIYVLDFSDVVFLSVDDATEHCGNLLVQLFHGPLLVDQDESRGLEF